MNLTAMQRRPVWRWKSFWLGVLVVVFLASSWMVSMRGYTVLHWRAVDWWVTGGSGAGGVGLRYNAYSAGSSGLLVERGPVVSGDMFPRAIIVNWPQVYRSYGVGMAYWFLIAVFMSLWGGFVFWRWRRMSSDSSSSSMPVSERVKCRQCTAMILEVTAWRNRGYCGVCVRTRGVRYRLMQVGMVFALMGFLVAMPCMVVWLACRDGWRRWQFPFDRKVMLARILSVHAGAWEARRYLEGVIDGYWDGDGEKKLVRRDSARWSIARNEEDGRPLLAMDPAWTYGLRDGARLRRGEIRVEEIPTWREVL